MIDGKRSQSCGALKPHGELIMRRTTALLASLALLSITSGAAADNAVQTGQSPYKPGRQIDGDPVKVTKPPYKPGREVDEVKRAKPPYKPGREAQADGTAKTSSKN